MEICISIFFHLDTCCMNFKIQDQAYIIVVFGSMKLDSVVNDSGHCSYFIVQP